MHIVIVKIAGEEIAATTTANLQEGIRRMKQMYANIQAVTINWEKI